MRKRILIVDDDQLTLDVLGRILALEGYECVSFSSAEEAMCRLRSMQRSSTVLPDLLITDYRMGEVNGIDLIIYMKVHYPEVRSILISAFKKKSAILSKMVDIADMFIEKPIKVDYLLQSIKTLSDKNKEIKNEALAR